MRLNLLNAQKGMFVSILRALFHTWAGFIVRHSWSRTQIYIYKASLWWNSEPVMSRLLVSRANWPSHLIRQECVRSILLEYLRSRKLSCQIANWLILGLILGVVNNGGQPLFFWQNCSENADQGMGLDALVSNSWKVCPIDSHPNWTRALEPVPVSIKQGEPGYEPFIRLTEDITGFSPL